MKIKQVEKTRVNLWEPCILSIGISASKSTSLLEYVKRVHLNQTNERKGKKKSELLVSPFTALIINPTRKSSKVLIFNRATKIFKAIVLLAKSELVSNFGKEKIT